MNPIELTHSKGSILLVDDMPENLKLLSELLIQLGYNIRSTTSGRMALKTLTAKQPDLILLDIKMPEMDGYQVCTAIKADEKLCDIPIIFISALDDTFDKVKAFECGGVDYITKPFQIEEVVARVENQLTIQRQKTALQKEVRKRQEAEEVLHQSRALLASVLNTALDGIAAMQAVRHTQTGEIEEFRCLVVNPVVARFFNKSREELIGKLVFKKIVNRINAEFFPRFVAVVENNETFTEDFYYPLNDSCCWYHFVAVKLGDGFAITIRDITVRKKMELELQKANYELQQKNHTLAENVKLREDIESITRHDLRTPLNAILGFPHVMLLDPGLSTKQRKYLEQILSSGNQMLTMINNSLNLLQMERGCYQCNPQPVEVVSIIERVIKDLQTLADSQRIKIKIQAAGNAFNVLVESDLTYSLFANLIRNAIEACVEDDCIIIAITYENGYAFISITNPGTVPETVREIFFDKYATYGKNHGSGIGTYSAKLMATTQNGNITMTTNNKETCVTVKLPLA